MIRMYLQAAQIMMREWEPLVLLSLLYVIASYLLTAPSFPVLEEVVLTDSLDPLRAYVTENPVGIAVLFVANIFLASFYYLLWARLWCSGRGSVFAGGPALILRRTGRILVRYLGTFVWFILAAFLASLVYFILGELASALGYAILGLAIIALILVIATVTAFLALALGACVTLEAQDKRAPLAEMMLLLRPHALKASLTAVMLFLPVFLFSQLPATLAGGAPSLDSFAGLLAYHFSSLIFALYGILLITVGGLLHERQVGGTDISA